MMCQHCKNGLYRPPEETDTRREHACEYPESCTCRHNVVGQDGEWDDFISVPRPE